MSDSSSLKNVLPACLSGCLLWAGTSFQGMGWPVLLVALVPVLVGLRGLSKKKVVYCGLLVGLIYNISLLYWIVIVLGRYGGLPWFVSLPALFILSFYLSTFLVVFLLAARFLLRCRSPLFTLWLLPCLWVGLDWVCSFLFSGFPWMDLGYALWKFPIFIQIADLFGHFGVTFLLVLVNVLLALLFLNRRKEGLRVLLILPVVLLLGGAALYSITVWQQGKKMLLEVPTAKIGVVQGNIDQSRKWLPQEQRQTVLNYLGQTDFLTLEADLDLVVWPETALPFYPGNSPLSVPIRSFIQKKGMALLTGSPWYEIVDPKKREIEYYNSALLFLPDGSFGEKYFKSHLVPFGEYVPLKKMLFFLAPLVEAVGDFTPGEVKDPLQHGNIRAGLLICFESIFPNIGRKWVDGGANVLVNLTNDAWYGKSSAPHQSFAMSVFRSVETRRSLVRSANTGISGFIDPLGRVQNASDIFVPWAAFADVYLVDKVSFAVSYGYLFAPLCFWLSLLVAAVFWLRYRFVGPFRAQGEDDMW